MYGKFYKYYYNFTIGEKIKIGQIRQIRLLKLELFGLI